MSLAPWRVVARAELTKTLTHGDRCLETRVFLADGRIMEQVNTGVPDLENDWREVGRYRDLRATLRGLRREGWGIRPDDGGDLAPRASVIRVLAGVVLLGFLLSILVPVAQLLGADR